MNKIRKALKSDNVENVESQNYDEHSSNDKNLPGFKYLDDLIKSGEKNIVLDSDIVLCPDESYDYKNGIILNVNDLTIDGNGYSIDGQKKASIFLCTAKNVTLKNITLKNGFTTYFGGGALRNNGEITIIESTLTQNIANSDAGGGMGGAILNRDDAKLTLIKSTLCKNRAEVGGGAIYNECGDVTISDSSLDNNIAKGNGGAIYNGEGNVEMHDSSINSNTVKECGGAICNNGGEFKIEKSKIDGNIANENGGALSNFHGNFKIITSEISQNTALNTVFNQDSLQINNTNFIQNQSRGIILNKNDKADLIVSHGKFIDNSVEEFIILNSGKSCSVNKSIFENNHFDNALINIINKSELTLINPQINDEGKTVYNEDYALVIDSPQDLLDKICGEGTLEVEADIIPDEVKFDFRYLDRKIHECNTNEFVLDNDICLENYERRFYEGGIELDIDNLVIDGNGKTIDGAGKSRIFIITGDNITLKNIIFKNGHSHKDYDNPFNSQGGALKINHDINLTIDNCRFESNTSDDDGGAICNRGKLTINESTFNKNKADFKGGTIQNNKGDVTIEESSFYGNTSNEGGGALSNYKGKLLIRKSSLDMNISKDLGGAVHNCDGYLTSNGSTFTRNFVTDTYDKYCASGGKGGGAIFNQKGKMTISNSTFEENFSGSRGGAIFNANGSFWLTRSTFNKNSAEYFGGAIYKNVGYFKIKDCSFNQNISKEEAGGHEIFLMDNVIPDGDQDIDQRYIMTHYKYLRITQPE